MMEPLRHVLLRTGELTQRDLLLCAEREVLAIGSEHEVGKAVVHSFLDDADPER